MGSGRGSSATGKNVSFKDYEGESTAPARSRLGDTTSRNNLQVDSDYGVRGNPDKN